MGNQDLTQCIKRIEIHPSDLWVSARPFRTFRSIRLVRPLELLRSRKAEKRMPLHLGMDHRANAFRNLSPFDRTTFFIRCWMEDSGVRFVTIRYLERYRAELPFQP